MAPTVVYKTNHYVNNINNLSRNNHGENQDHNRNSSGSGFVDSNGERVEEEEEEEDKQMKR